MKVITKGNASPKGKSRVFFTCHPSDWDKSFNRICEDVFKTHDVAIYYIDMDTEDGLDSALLETDLNQMSLFIISVSFKLLTEPSFALDTALPLAKREHIPILPIVLEPGLYELYQKEEHFGALEYLRPDSTDSTIVSYEKKLKDFLDEKLIGDELKNRVRKAFDAYVFLSYRKKDRAHANELMRLIHRDPLCRDIAIWYDEYLTPGEAFDEGIAKALEKSELFTLLVTPNLINEKNYVQTKEYPKAKESDISILPVEMVDTDRKMLEEQYPGIPECIRGEEEEKLKKSFLENLNRIAKTANHDEPEHNYLIGLAYLEGIDTEVDKAKAVNLITEAANTGLPEAMIRLSQMYEGGDGVETNIPLSLDWLERGVQSYETILPEDDNTLLEYRDRLAIKYIDMGKYSNAIKLETEVYNIRKQTIGYNHQDTIRSLNILATAYHYDQKYDIAISLSEQIIDILGAESKVGISCLINIANAYGEQNKTRESLKYAQQAYKNSVALDGNSLSSVDCLFSLACAYSDMRDKENLNNARKKMQKAYDMYKEKLGDDNPNTLLSLMNLGTIYQELGNPVKSIANLNSALEGYRMVFSESHPLAIKCLFNLAVAYDHFKQFEDAIATIKKAYDLNCQLYGSDNWDSLRYLSNLSSTYRHKALHENNKDILDESKRIALITYEKCLELYTEGDDLTIFNMENLALIYLARRNRSECNEAYRLAKKVYLLRRENHGDDHFLTLKANELFRNIEIELKSIN